MNRYFVGVDLGATSGRVILATLCGEGIALEVLPPPSLPTSLRTSAAN